MQAFFVLRKSVALSGFVSPAETSHTQPATALLKLPDPHDLCVSGFTREHGRSPCHPIHHLWLKVGR